jgi:hypothetical protein
MPKSCTLRVLLSNPVRQQRSRRDAIDEAAQFGIRGIAIVDRRRTGRARDAGQNEWSSILPRGQKA